MRIHPLNDCCFYVERQCQRYTFFFQRKVKCLDDVSSEGIRVALSSLCFLVEQRMDEMIEPDRVGYQMQGTPEELNEAATRLIEYGCWNHVFRNASLLNVVSRLHPEQAGFLFHPATEETDAALTMTTLAGVVENGEVDTDITSDYFPCLHRDDAPFA